MTKHEEEVALFLAEIGKAWGPEWQAVLEHELREGTLVFCGWVDKEAVPAGPPSRPANDSQLKLL